MKHTHGSNSAETTHTLTSSAQSQLFNQYNYCGIFCGMNKETLDKIVVYVKKKEFVKFNAEVTVPLIEGNIFDLFDRLEKQEIELLIHWCMKKNIYFIDKPFEGIENANYLQHLDKIANKVDSEKRNLLHIAAIKGCKFDILEYLKKTLRISILSKDANGYTPLHYYCQVDKCHKKILELLNYDIEHWTTKSNDGFTPLELACSNDVTVKKILKIVGPNDFANIVRIIDNVLDGVMDVKDDQGRKDVEIEEIWHNLFLSNEKDLLLSYIKNEKKLLDNYFLDENRVISIINKCPKNGQGIIKYVMSLYNNDKNFSLNKVFVKLTGIKINGDYVNSSNSFIKSAPFLALITGRFKLVTALLRRCQFHIVPYAMLICLICEKLANNKNFPEQARKDLRELKQSCEAYSIDVINRSYNNDLNKSVVGNYLSQETDTLQKKSILEVAYGARCTEFLCLPGCQDTLDNMWYENKHKCPAVTFGGHVLCHICFLALFSVVVLNYMFSEVSALEHACYVYGLGYLVEELWQACIFWRKNIIGIGFFDFVYPSDILALLFLLIGFVFRISFAYKAVNSTIFDESRDTYLFVQRLFLSLSLIAFYVRSLYMLSINSTFGTRLKMIRMMINRDLTSLLIIFIIFLISFGIAFQSLLFPNSFYKIPGVSSFNVSLIREDWILVVGEMFRRMSLTIFDLEFTLKEIDRDTNKLAGIVYRQVAVYVLLLLFMVVVNVMLMNLLIALFSYTVTKIIEEPEKWWKSHRYRFLQKYANRTIVPPPFNIISIAIYLLINCDLSSENIKKHYEKLRNSDTQRELPKLSQVPLSLEKDFSSYYIYQAFALMGHRHQLQDTKDVEGKYVNLTNKLEIIQEKLKTIEDYLRESK